MKLLILIRFEYVFDSSEMQAVATAPLGPDGKAALIERYKQHRQTAHEPLYLCPEDAVEDNGGCSIAIFYVIEEIDYLTGEQP